MIVSRKITQLGLRFVPPHLRPRAFVASEIVEEPTLKVHLSQDECAFFVKRAILDREDLRKYITRVKTQADRESRYSKEMRL